MNEKKFFSKNLIVLLVAVVALMAFNQYQLSSLSGLAVATTSFQGDGKDLSSLDVSQLKSTGHTLAAVFPVEDIKSTQDAINMLVPKGTPEYGNDLGVSFDDPVSSLSKLAQMYRPLKAEVQKSNPDAWNRFMNLASKPVGISCEFCCGLNAVGIDKNGNSMCGCQHNPALLSVALYLTAYTDYSDAEILREVMRWKTLFFPKNMVELGMTVAGGDTSALKDLPGMVGGC